jgi:hypothetical protein
MILTGLVILGALWCVVVACVLGLCASAARGDRALRGGAAQTLPRRSTCRTVRMSSLMSAQSDQLATYR